MRMPYFDLLLDGRGRGDRASGVFSSHVHWGMWPRVWLGQLRDRDMTEAMARMDDAIIVAARISDGDRVADIGCGFGGTLSRLSERYPSSELTGVNLDARQLAVAVPSRAAFVCADASTLPLPDASLDAALAVECIFHFPSRQEFLTEAARVLRPGARLALSDFVPWRIGLQHGRIGQWALRQVAKGFGPLSNWPDGDYRAMAARAGLEVERVEDVTVRTIPTYLFFLKLALRRGFGGQEKPLIWPTMVAAALSSVFLCRYQIVTLRKPGPAQT